MRSKARRSWIGSGGAKLARISPCASSSASHSASFTSRSCVQSTFFTCAALGQDQGEFTVRAVNARPASSHPGRLHRDMRATMLAQPCRQLQQSRRGRGEGPNLTTHLGSSHQAMHTPPRCPCVHPGRRSADTELPYLPPFARRRRRAPWGETLNGVLPGLAARGDNRGCFGWPRVQSNTRARSHRLDTADLSASDHTSVPQVSSMVGRHSGGQLIPPPPTCRRSRRC